MSLEKVHQCLLSVVRDNFTSPEWDHRIQWENLHFTPSAGVTWLSVHFQPAGEVGATLGPNGKDKSFGLFIVNVHVPLGVGELTSRKEINKLRDCFLPGPRQYEGQEVTIVNRSRGRGLDHDNHFVIPFTVHWRAYLNRPS
jgi:Bacteriophage related domain of unknown function